MRKNMFVRFFIIAIFITALNSLGSCSVGISTQRTTTVVRKSKPLPPGQAKKIYGDKSAKNYTKKRR